MKLTRMQKNIAQARNCEIYDIKKKYNLTSQDVTHIKKLARGSYWKNSELGSYSAGAYIAFSPKGRRKVFYKGEGLHGIDKACAEIWASGQTNLSFTKLYANYNGYDYDVSIEYTKYKNWIKTSEYLIFKKNMNKCQICCEGKNKLILKQFSKLQS